MWQPEIVFKFNKICVGDDQVADTVKITISNEKGEERKRIYNTFFHYSAATGKYVEARNIRDTLNYSIASYECRYE